MHYYVRKQNQNRNKIKRWLLLLSFSRIPLPSQEKDITDISGMNKYIIFIVYFSIVTPGFFFPVEKRKSSNPAEGFFGLFFFFNFDNFGLFFASKIPRPGSRIYVSRRRKKILVLPLIIHPTKSFIVPFSFDSLSSVVVIFYCFSLQSMKDRKMKIKNVHEKKKKKKE